MNNIYEIIKKLEAAEAKCAVLENKVGAAEANGKYWHGQCVDKDKALDAFEKRCVVLEKEVTAWKSSAEQYAEAARKWQAEAERWRVVSLNKGALVDEKECELERKSQGIRSVPALLKAADESVAKIVVDFLLFFLVTAALIKYLLS